MLVALLFLAGRCTWGLLREPGFEDFGQYYMGGVIACEGAWEALYPMPLPGATKNAGWRDGSTMKPAYGALARSRGVGDVNRFVLPPPMAIVFAPLALLPWREAAWVWAALMILCGWGVAVLAGRLYEIAAGNPSRVAGALCLLVATSPLMRRAIGTSQISPLVALCAGAGILALWRRRDLCASAAIVAGGLAKVATIALLPLAALLGRIRLLATVAILTAAVVIVSLLATGLDPFLEFAGEIAPTLRHSSAWRGNQSIAGFMLRVTGETALPEAAATALSLSRILLFGAVFTLIWRARRVIASSAPSLMAAAAALLLSLLILSPIFWEHYFVYLCPLWGWLAWEASLSWRRAIIAGAAVASTWAPLAIAPWLKLREPLTSHMLAAAILMLGLAVSRLLAESPSQGAAGPPPGTAAAS